MLDIDGTVFSSEDMIHQVYVEEFTRFRTEHGRPEKIPTLDEIVAQIGKPVVEIFQNLTPELDEGERHGLSEGVLSNLVARIDNGQGEHYDGVHDTLKQARERGIHFHAASNGREAYIRAILRANGTLDWFHPVRAVDNRTIHNKNELVATILRDNGLDPAHCLMVGDRASDRDAALANDVAFAACNFGHGNKQEQEGAAVYLDRFEDLLTLIS